MYGEESGSSGEDLMRRTSGINKRQKQARDKKPKEWRTSPQHGDLRFLGPPTGQGAGSGARTRDRRIPADLRAESLTAVPPTAPFNTFRDNGGVGGSVVSESALSAKTFCRGFEPRYRCPGLLEGLKA
ncbi:hypothetical protein PoB_000221800 [Plakobranchus ocellatus]|uniref:Uncharacterized protein n=1 Tax=Plakobranchus ocellatus TaxID=259542 RepID=A0AAV3Y0D1_9GAST|nr:hypothetical protein PoB_000221800 [Plakobranchus ocellatus]